MYTQYSVYTHFSFIPKPFVKKRMFTLIFGETKRQSSQFYEHFMSYLTYERSWIKEKSVSCNAQNIRTKN